jgi:hypothetical protein
MPCGHVSRIDICAISQCGQVNTGFYTVSISTT